MHTITIRLKAVEFFVAIVEIREWLDCNRYEPVRFKYDQDEDDVVLSVDFKTEAAASAFARRFGGLRQLSPSSGRGSLAKSGS
jgi:hypothetical protein